MMARYSVEEFKIDFPRLKEGHFYDMKFRYAIALQDFDPWDGDWGNDREAYLFTFARVGGVVGGGRNHVLQINCKDHIKKGEIFICATTCNNILHTAIRGTGIMTVEYPPINCKRKDGKDQRIASYLSHKKFKRQRPIWDWFNKEMDIINFEANKVTRELNDSFYYLDNFGSVEKNEIYKFSATSKNIKTKYGIDKNCYSEDFEKEIDEAAIKIHESIEDLKRFSNYKEFHLASFPVFEVSYQSHTYLFEKRDFNIIKPEIVEKVEIEYVNKWEDKLIELEKKRKALVRWRDRAFEKIKSDIYRNYLEYAA